MFNDRFQGAADGEIIRAIHEDGFYFCPAALDGAFVSQITEDADAVGHGLHRNWISGVFTHRQYFVTHMLAASKAFVDYATSPRLFTLYRKLLGPAFRLKAIRYYETWGGMHMQWHTDNKVGREKAKIPGVIAIVYLSDVQDGEFQYVRGSHAWSGEVAYNDYPDDVVDREYGDRVVSFKGAPGSMLLYDTYGIHRAKPVKDRKFVRKSLFLQVDAETENAEPMLLNPALLSRWDEETARFLGFGRAAEYPLFPDTRLHHHPMSKISLRDAAAWLAVRLASAIVPQSAREPLKRLLRRA